MAAPRAGFPEPTLSSADQLCAELRSSWSTLADLINSVSQASLSLRGTAFGPRASLHETGDQYEAESRLLLAASVEQFLRYQPLQRSFKAIQKCDQELGASRARQMMDARFQRLLTESAIDLCEPWRIRRRGSLEGDWAKWDQRCARHTSESAALLERYEHWAHDTNEHADPTTQLRDKRNEDKGRDQRYATWARLDQAVNAQLQIEVSLRDLVLTWFRTAGNFVEIVKAEREEILARGARLLEWIQAGAEGGSTRRRETPELVSAEERQKTWMSEIEARANARLPEHSELLVPTWRALSTLSGWRPQWRKVAPRHIFLTAFSTYVHGSMRQSIEQYWGQSAEIVREMTRALEIVDYWRDVSDAKSDEEKDLFDDARHNAASMLQTGLENGVRTPLATEDLEAKLMRVLTAWSKEGSIFIEAALYGWTDLLRQPRGRTFFVRTTIQSGQQYVTKSAERGGRWVSDRFDRLLETLGGRIPTHSNLEPVVRRTTLRDTLSLPASKIGLPTLYRLLFRIAPVEDNRFLIGRSQELAGLDQAVKDWEAGRFAACLVVGARGSGKTSLLNCAAESAFAGHTLVRGQFGERVLTREKIDSYLRTLLQLDQEADLDAAFAEVRRILVIEEAERTYLRRVGGFDAADYLMHLIHRTASTTLWIIGMNDKALRVLDAGAQFRRVFSHRINATSVSREDLEKAILERHRLSGLHLEFAPPPAEDPRVSRVKQWVGLNDSPQKLFFDSLFQQSEGILRSALELWLSSIDHVEGETLKIRQPLDPAFNTFRSELAREDHFTLLTIQEHGSLTQNELAEVLCEPTDNSRNRMDRLAALGLIEPDPEHPGLRVRPEAQRFTNDVLRRANLT